MYQKEYSESANIKYISKSTKYVDETGEHEMTETKSRKSIRNIMAVLISTVFGYLTYYIT